MTEPSWGSRQNAIRGICDGPNDDGPNGDGPGRGPYVSRTFRPSGAPNDSEPVTGSRS